MFSKEEILKCAKLLDVKFDKFTLDDLIVGVNIELEHGLISPKTNVTNDNLMITMKIVLAHLNEFSDYYNMNYGLPALEIFLTKKKNLKKK